VVPRDVLLNPVCAGRGAPASPQCAPGRAARVQDLWGGDGLRDAEARRHLASRAGCSSFYEAAPRVKQVRLSFLVSRQYVALALGSRALRVW